MTKDELLDATDAATDDNGRGKGSVTALRAKSKDELYEMAQEKDIDGRSSMSKDDLVDALANKS
nr:Rho termination factor N-terminal domain-containing protein [Hoeflea halophila]